MSVTISRRAFLTLTAAGLGQAAWALGPEASLRPVARAPGHYKRAVAGPEALIAQSGLDGQVTFAVADAATGLRLEGHAQSEGVPPASVTKAITALYALDVLGPGHRFVTRLVATGGIENGEIKGDLVLVGGGDPTLDTDALAGLAAGLKAQGIRAVRGQFRVSEGMLPRIRTIDPGQPDHVGYSPAISGIALNHNRVHFEWKRAGQSYAVTMDARTARYRPEVAMATMRVAQRRMPVYTYEDAGGRDAWTVAGPALGKGGSRWLPVRRPGAYAGDVFRTLARSHGIVLKPAKVVTAIPGGDVMATHASPTLRTICAGMLRYSNNLTAEMVGLSATRARRGGVRTLRASAGEMNTWAREVLGVGGLRLVDHSGLGPDSQMSADDMVAALVKVHGDDRLRPILKQITLRDDNGRPNKAHPIKVRAKTGTLNFVSGLAGYLTAQDGTVMAFAIFAADQDRRAKIGRANRERPQGARPWNRRAKALQQALIERWGTLYGT